MIKKNTRLSLIILTAVAIILSIDCSPAPMIQSAHVNSSVKTGINVTASGMNGGYEDFNPYYLALGIKDRVELSASFYPFFPVLVLGASANMKIFLFERGNEGLFRNIATAVFSGGKTTSGERETCSSANAGIIVSTIYKGDRKDIELVFQPSFFRLIETDSYESGQGIEDYTRVDGLHFNCGAIFNIDPNRDNRFSFGVRTGGGYQLALHTKSTQWAWNNELKCYTPGLALQNSDYNAWFIEFGLDFNWKSRRQMRKH